MEAKLREYRALRRRQQLIEDGKEKLKVTKEKILNFVTPKFLSEMSQPKDDEVLLLESDEDVPQEPPAKSNGYSEITPEKTDNITEESIDEENPESWRYFTIKWTIYCLIWVTLYLIFLKLQFGAVFFVISALIGICINTRTRPKKKGEVSAYSVFNENCTSIDGTLKAEQLERQMLYGPIGLR